MADVGPGSQIGRRIAPGPFLLFAGLFVAGTAALWPVLGSGRAVMGAFDLGALAYLLRVFPLLRHAAADIRAAASANDANRAALLVVTAVVLLVILVSVADELRGRSDAVSVALALGTLTLAWLFANTVYAFHYAHLFYSDDRGKDAGGLDFPGCSEPLYWEFAYFAFTLGMTFQTSDVSVTARGMRRVVVGQCLAAFVFNLGVLGFTVNVLGGG